MAGSLLAVAAASAAVTAATGVSAGPVRGVAPINQVKYAGADGKFACFTGGDPLPLAAVNDDFCDCADGSDEPGTSACGGKRDTLFYCSNEESVPAYLYPSRVNDGVCDCCDGSDEWRGRRAPGQQNACANTCTAEGKHFRKERERRESEWRKGMARRKHLIDFARSERRKSDDELASHRPDLPGLEAAEMEAAKALEAANQIFAEEQKSAAAAAASESNAGESVSTAPPTDSAEKPGPSSDEASPATAPVSDEAAPATPEPAPAEGAVISEYTKWMEGAEEALDSAGAGAATKKVAAPALSRALVEEDDYEDEDDEESTGSMARPPEDFKRAKRKSGFFGRAWARAKEIVSGIFGGATRSPAERERDRAEDAHADAEKALKDKYKKIAELEKRVNVAAVDGDDKLAYHSLNGKCISKKFTEYKYEVCFFKTAKQDSMSIGNWKDWESPGVALFTGGQHCPGGPARSLRVVFKCGPREEIEEVSEPSRCAYQTTIMHPAACADEPPEGVGGTEVRPRMPTDEL